MIIYMTLRRVNFIIRREHRMSIFRKLAKFAFFTTASDVASTIVTSATANPNRSSDPTGTNCFIPLMLAIAANPRQSPITALTTFLVGMSATIDVNDAARRQSEVNYQGPGYGRR